MGESIPRGARLGLGSRLSALGSNYVLRPASTNSDATPVGTRQLAPLAGGPAHDYLLLTAAHGAAGRELTARVSFQSHAPAENAVQGRTIGAQEAEKALPQHRLKQFDRAGIAALAQPEERLAAHTGIAVCARDLEQLRHAFVARQLGYHEDRVGLELIVVRA